MRDKKRKYQMSRIAMYKILIVGKSQGSIESNKRLMLWDNKRGRHYIFIKNLKTLDI